MTNQDLYNPILTGAGWQGDSKRFDTPQTAALYKFLDTEVNNRQRVTGLSIECDGVFIYTDSSKWCDDAGAGTFRGDSETAAIKAFKDRVQPASNLDRNDYDGIKQDIADIAEERLAADAPDVFGYDHSRGVAVLREDDSCDICDGTGYADNERQLVCLDCDAADAVEPGSLESIEELESLVEPDHEACPYCGSVHAPVVLGVLGDLQWIRCRSCGSAYDTEV